MTAMLASNASFMFLSPLGERNMNREGEHLRFSDAPC